MARTIVFANNSSNSNNSNTSSNSSISNPIVGGSANSLSILSNPIADSSMEAFGQNTSSLSREPEARTTRLVAPLFASLTSANSLQTNPSNGIRFSLRESTTGNSSSFTVPRRLEAHPFELLASRLGYAEDGIGNAVVNPFIHALTTQLSDSLHKKHVYKLECVHCRTNICSRAMRVILLSNVKVELFSTDTPESTVSLVFEDYVTGHCSCKIRDIACLGCVNSLGYHVTQPCVKCLEGKNNGHFWMFNAENVVASYRVNPLTKQLLCWGTIDQWETEYNNFLNQKHQAFLREQNR